MMAGRFWYVIFILYPDRPLSYVVFFERLVFFPRKCENLISKIFPFFLHRFDAAESEEGGFVFPELTASQEDFIRTNDPG